MWPSPVDNVSKCRWSNLAHEKPLCKWGLFCRPWYHVPPTSVERRSYSSSFSFFHHSLYLWFVLLSFYVIFTPSMVSRKPLLTSNKMRFSNNYIPMCTIYLMRKGKRTLRVSVQLKCRPTCHHYLTLHSTTHFSFKRPNFGLSQRNVKVGGIICTHTTVWLKSKCDSSNHFFSIWTFK